MSVHYYNDTLTGFKTCVSVHYNNDTLTGSSLVCQCITCNSCSEGSVACTFYSVNQLMKYFQLPTSADLDRETMVVSAVVAVWRTDQSGGGRGVQTASQVTRDVNASTAAVFSLGLPVTPPWLPPSC